MTDTLAKLLNQALDEIESQPDLQNLHNDSKMEGMLDKLPYSAMAEVELLKDESRSQVAIELLQKIQKDVADMLDVQRDEFAKIKQKLDHPLLPPTDRIKFVLELRNNSLQMVKGFYVAMGISNETAAGLAETQVKDLYNQ